MAAVTSLSRTAVLAILLGLVLVAAQLSSQTISDIPMIRTFGGVAGAVFLASFLIFRFNRLHVYRGSYAFFLVFIVYLCASSFMRLATGLKPLGLEAPYMLSLLQVAILCFCASILAREPQAFALTWLIYICVMAYVALDVILGLPFFGMRLPGYSGFFQNNRNALSYQWAMGAVTCLWFVFRVPKSQTLNQVACYSLLMLFSAAVFAAGSRTGAGALVIALMAILFFEFRKRSLPLYVTAIPVVISALWFMLMGSEGLLLRFQRTFAGEDYGVRDVIFEHAWVLAKARPMFGYGPTYVFDLGPALGWRALAAHSAYFHMLLTAGFLGSFVFIALLVRIALELRTHWAMPTARLAAALLLLSLAFGVTGNLFNSEVFWVLLGMCMSVRYWYVPTAINGASIRALLTGHGSAQKRHCSRFNSPVPW